MNQWGCDRCQQPVVPMQTQYRPQSDAGAIILKVVIFIIVLVVCVAIRVGVRSAFR